MTEPSTQEQSTELTVAGRAAVALKATERKQKFVALAAQSAGITAITNGDGYKECHAARMLLKNTRIEVEKEGKKVREDAVAFQKAVVALQSEIVGLIEPEEKRLQAIQDAYDAKIEAARQSALQAEKERKEAEARQAREAEEARLAEAQAEIDRQKALLAEAEEKRIKAEREAAERIAQAERDAAARIEAAERAARQKIEEEQREARRQQEESDRLAREKLATEQAAVAAAEAEAKRKKIIEDARIASENEALERKRRAVEDEERRAREAQEAKERADREAKELAERQEREAAEAAAKVERDRIEAEAREKRLEEQTTMDGMELLRNFVARYGHRREFLPITAAINAFLAGPAGTAGQFVGGRDETQG